MMLSSRVPPRLLLGANSRRSMTRLCTQRGSGAGDSMAFLKNKKTQERRVYKSTADLPLPEEKTPQWAEALLSIIKSERQYLQSLDSNMQSLESKMLGLAGLMVGLATIGFTATAHMIDGQNAKFDGQNTKIDGQNAKIDGQNAKIDGQNAKIEAATTSKGLFHSHP